MTDKMASQMKVCFKLFSLRHSGCLFVKTIDIYLRISFKCLHLLCGIVAYHNNGQTLVANELKFSYVHVETVLLCQAVNHQFNYIGINYTVK